MRFDHVSVPCRDLEEGLSFFVDLLGGELRVLTPIFAEVRIGGSLLGFGTKNPSFMLASTEYPHIGFVVDAAEMTELKERLTRHGIPTSNCWTRGGVEALMFFRDPSGNVFELVCPQGFPDADALPRGPAAGHGISVDVDAIAYDAWQPPETKGPRYVK